MGTMSFPKRTVQKITNGNPWPGIILILGLVGSVITLIALWIRVNFFVGFQIGFMVLSATFIISQIIDLAVDGDITVREFMGNVFFLGVINALGLLFGPIVLTVIIGVLIIMMVSD